MTKRRLIEDFNFTVDREKKLVRDNAKMETAVLLQTQVAVLRNGKGELIGIEVLHHCRRKDGTKFIIDESDDVE